MLSIAYYILKVTVCSGVLYGYYRIMLHNKVFHRWNRFYLLFAVLISLILPLIRISIGRTAGEDESQVVKLLNIVTTGDEFVYNISYSSNPHLTEEQALGIIYLTVSVIFLVLLVHTLIRLNRLIRSNPLQQIEGIKVVQTDAKGTPFSFFRYIFWNRNMDMHSEAGEKIFMHEMVHVTERHSADRLFMNIVLIFFWCNPFFWLIRQEINMIHEFIADKKTIEDKDASVFASMILHAVYPQQTFGLTSNFFSSSIKRRLHMLTKMQNPVLNYISRLLVLPLLTIVFVAFTVKTTGSATIKEEVSTSLEGTVNYSSDNLHRKDPNSFFSGANVSVDKDLKSLSDTLPAHIKSVDITKDDQVIIIYKNNTAEKITKAQAVKRGVISAGKWTQAFNSGKLLIADSVLCFIDGAESPKSEVEKINPDEIETMSVLKDKTATDKYGERAKNGVIEITIKKR